MIFSRLKELRVVETMLREAGFKGGLIEMIKACMDLLMKQNQLIEDAAKELNEGIEEQQATVAYFIPYEVTHSEYANGGKRKSYRDMTVLEVSGGVHNWTQLMGIRSHIQNGSPAKDLANAEIMITGLFEIDRWKTEQPQVVKVNT